MKILKIDPEKPEKALIILASDAIKEGKILIYPTDTVYGIGCSVRSRNIEKIFEIKKRSPKNPLSVAFSDLEMIKRYVVLTSREERFVKDNILGHYTFIVRKRESISGTITAGKDMVGVRIPNHGVVKGIIRSAGIPIITTSANISGEKAPASFDEIDEELINKVDLAIDSGRCRIGKPSAVIDLRSGKFLRESR